MIIELDLPDSAENISCFYQYKGNFGETIYAAKAIQKIKQEELRCGLCGELDYSCMYASDPPQYKCEKYGHIVRVTDKCRGDKNAEE